jgi:NosR/NirI family nitrous oxide reductase transcriptional regulator
MPSVATLPARIPDDWRRRRRRFVLSAKLALLVRLTMIVMALWGLAAPVHASELGRFLAKVKPEEMLPGADRFGPVEGTPPAAAIYRGERLAGYAFLTSDVIGTIGYSGKPIHVLVAVNLGGVITGARLVEHSEPIVLVGIPESKVRDFIAGYVGLNVVETVTGTGREIRPVDIISGATVTVIVIHDSITRSAIRIARSRGLGGLAASGAEAAPGRRMTIDPEQTGTADWITLLDDGSVRRLLLTLRDVNAAFERSGPPEAAERPERGDPDDIFIDLHGALVTAPLIGRSLLGEAEYANLLRRIKPGQQAVLVAANGRYSFKGAGYVRGGIFDRIHVVQGENTFRFRDRDHERLGDLAAKGAPRFREIGVFIIPEGAEFDPTEPWRLDLLVQRAVGPIEKAFITVSQSYRLPEKYLRPAAPPVAAPAAKSPAALEAEEEAPPLWHAVWRSRVLDIGVLSAAIVVLTAIFFFQNWLVRRPRLADGVRIGFLLFTLVWIGGYAQAQLSVVNVMAFLNALVTGFHWDYFLMEPTLFLLWFSVAASLLFWGRGPYCGWLCPFGAMQELANKLAKLARLPQITVPWGLHERLWPVKYMIFLVLFGISLYSLGLAEKLAEIEPFKTAIVLRFLRDWPFVLYSVLLLVVGLFIERFFCRYLCPLGAALAIPGRLRMFDWLRRYRECGNPCQRCRNECMVQAIHPEGHINPNECLYCLHCQQLYVDDHRCPVMIARRLKRERRVALESKSLKDLKPSPAEEVPEPAAR